MGRTAQPVEPGTEPTPEKALTADTATTAAELEQVADQDLQAKVKAAEDKVAELTAIVHALAKNQTATMPQAAAPLPTMAEAMKKKHAIPVLTTEGWLVPEIHPTDRKAA